MIVEYNKYIKRPCVSFDFDGVLHLSMVKGTIHPLNYDDYKSWIPSIKMHRILRSEHRAGNKIVLISARGKFGWIPEDDIVYEMKPVIQKFLKKYHLPVDQIILTSDQPKAQFLKNINTIRHYDDNWNLIYELDEDTHFEFVYVHNDEIIDRIKL